MSCDFLDLLYITQWVGGGFDPQPKLLSSHSAAPQVTILNESTSPGADSYQPLKLIVLESIDKSMPAPFGFFND